MNLTSALIQAAYKMNVMLGVSRALDMEEPPECPCIPLPEASAETLGFLEGYYPEVFLAAVDILFLDIVKDRIAQEVLLYTGGPYEWGTFTSGHIEVLMLLDRGHGKYTMFPADLFDSVLEDYEDGLLEASTTQDVQHIAAKVDLHRYFPDLPSRKTVETNSLN